MVAHFQISRVPRPRFPRHSAIGRQAVVVEAGVKGSFTLHFEYCTHNRVLLAMEVP